MTVDVLGLDRLADRVSTWPSPSRVDERRARSGSTAVCTTTSPIEAAEPDRLGQLRLGRAATRPAGTAAPRAG